MMFRQAKYELESLFASRWNETPVHFGGQEFKTSNDEWINVVVSPLRTRNASVSNTSYDVHVQLFVVVWAKNDVRNMELVDMVNQFIEEKSDIMHDGSTINDHGWNEANSVYTIMDFIFNFKTACVRVSTAITVDSTKVTADSTKYTADKG